MPLSDCALTQMLAAWSSLFFYYILFGKQRPLISRVAEPSNSLHNQERFSSIFSSEYLLKAILSSSSLLFFFFLYLYRAPIPPLHIGGVGIFGTLIY